MCGCTHTCEGGPGGGTGVAWHQDFMVVLPGQGAVDHPVAVRLGLAVVPGELKAGGRPRAHPQVLGGIDLCATQGREALSHRRGPGMHPVALAWLNSSGGVPGCDVHEVPCAVPPPQGPSPQKGLGHQLSPPAQHRLGDATHETDASAGAFTASLSKLLRELIACYLKRKVFSPCIRVRETEAMYIREKGHCSSHALA